TLPLHASLPTKPNTPTRVVAFSTTVAIAFLFFTSPSPEAALQPKPRDWNLARWPPAGTQVPLKKSGCLPQVGGVKPPRNHPSPSFPPVSHCSRRTRRKWLRDKVGRDAWARDT